MEVTFQPQSASVTISSATMGISVGTPILTKYIERENYNGSYTITPSTTTQTLSTEGLVMKSDLVINPIPSNYGLITWNGSTLTVS